MLKLFANLFWIHTPGIFQKQISKFFAKIFSFKVSRYFIFPYCILFGLSAEYLDQFEPESGETAYYSYSDFFKRKYKSRPQVSNQTIWPCEGYVCDWGWFSQKNKTKVKGEILNLNEIFKSNQHVTEEYYFTNIFLHNHNYHRVHSPVNGTISKITQVAGDLIFLRPWFYKRGDVSYPAVRNERYIFEIIDQLDRPWYLAMVGGFGVGSIELANNFTIGSQVRAGQEIAKFNLGSTVCLATPMQIKIERFLQTVCVGKILLTDEDHV